MFGRLSRTHLQSPRRRPAHFSEVAHPVQTPKKFLTSTLIVGAHGIFFLQYLKWPLGKIAILSVRCAVLIIYTYMVHNRSKNARIKNLIQEFNFETLRKACDWSELFEEQI